MVFIFLDDKTIWDRPMQQVLSSPDLTLLRHHSPSKRLLDQNSSEHYKIEPNVSVTL